MNSGSNNNINPSQLNINAEKNSSLISNSQLQQQKQQGSSGNKRRGRNAAVSRKRDHDQVLRDLVTALAVCHNVTPIVDEQTEIVIDA